MCGFGSEARMFAPAAQQAQQASSQQSRANQTAVPQSGVTTTPRHQRTDDSANEGSNKGPRK